MENSMSLTQTQCAERSNLVAEIRSRELLAPVVPRPTLREHLAFLILTVFNQLMKVACVRYETFLFFFHTLPPWYLDWVGRLRARSAFYRAARMVPAYARFLISNNCRIDNDSSIVSIGKTDSSKWMTFSIPKNSVIAVYKDNPRSAETLETTAIVVSSAVLWIANILAHTPGISVGF